MKMSLRKKLIGSFLVVILLTLIIGVNGIYESKSLFADLEEVSLKWLPKAELVKDVNKTVADHRIWEVANVMAALTNDQVALDEYKVKLANERTKFKEQMNALNGMLVTDKEKAGYADVNAKWEAYLTVAAKVEALINEGKHQEAFKLLRGDSRTAYGSITAGVTDFIKTIDDEVARIDQEMADSYQRSRNISIGLLVGAILLGVSFGIYSASKISRAVNQVTNTAIKVADGNLAVDILKIKTGDEIETMSEAINKMVSGLRTLVEKISTSAQEVVTASEELTATAEETSMSTQQVVLAIDEVAKGTMEQANSVNQAVQMVNQLNDAVGQIANGAQQQSTSVDETNQIVSQMVTVIHEVASSAQAVTTTAEKTSGAANAGGEAVNKTIDGMEKIKNKVFEAAGKISQLGEQSAQISDIIQVIDDIAEQTNLLALNAAIEAARAGEHGKGFAVVADEVRKLAEKSSKATKEIAELISGIQSGTNQAVNAMNEGTKEVEVGSNLAKNAGEALKQILATVSETYDQTQNISAAAEQMAASSDSVVKAIDAVSQVTENNTAATQEMTAASSQVSGDMESVAAITEENSAAIEQVSASTQQISVATEQTTAAAESLARMAMELEETISAFKL